jgi:ferric-dicitrate binding protein FerR (iron transport regulator)
VPPGFGRGRPQVRAELAAVRWSLHLLDQVTEPDQHGEFGKLAASDPTPRRQLSRTRGLLGDGAVWVAELPVAPEPHPASARAAVKRATAVRRQRATMKPDHERGQASLPMGRRAQPHQQPSHGQTGDGAAAGLNNYAAARLD